MKNLHYLFSILFLLFSCSGNETPPNPGNTTKMWTVAFNSNGGSAVSSISYIKDGTTIKKPADPERKRYVFAGWYTDNETFTNAWEFATSQVVSDTTLYAKWEFGEDTYMVTFDSNGGSAVTPAENIEYGSTIEKPADPTKISYKFDAWCTDKIALKNEWNFAEDVVTEDITLYARWTAKAIPDVTYSNLNGVVQNCADPYVLKYEGKYYMYGTGGSDGIRVYQSDNMVKWSSAIGATNGYALHKSHVWGDKNFWAPEVYYIDNKFYMFYSAEEHIAVATSNSPLGPFSQSEAEKKPFHADIKEIDTHLFIDDDGKKYLYFVRFTNGNEIWAAELNDDMRSIKESTLKRCIGATNGLQMWEKSTLEPQAGFKCNEGPFVLKRNGTYYLTYSANHYQNPNYGVGYATSSSPLGPWSKYAGNPILTKTDKIQGVGHHSFISMSEHCHYIIYHAHYNMTSVGSRKTCIDPYEFIPSSNGLPDIIKTYGPTTTSQVLCNESDYQ